MKKFFTLIATALVALSASAVSWNFSDFTTASYESTTTVDGLTIYAASGKAIAIDESSKKATVNGSEVSYTKRLKFGGTGSAERCVSFSVTGASKITVVATSSSNSGEDRNLSVSYGSAYGKNAIGTIKAPVGSLNVGSVNYTGSEATTIYIGSVTSGVNIYAIYVEAGSEGGGEGGEVSGDYLINYPTSKAGIEIGGTTVYDNTQKYHLDKETSKNISLANGYTTDGVINANCIVLSVEGGFKAGDVVSVAGYFNNTDETKQAAVAIFTGEEGDEATVLWRSELFINGRTNSADPDVQTYTLTDDAEYLKVGRSDGLTSATRTNVTLLTVTRSSATAVESVAEVKAEAKKAVKFIKNGKLYIGNYNIAGQQVK